MPEPEPVTAAEPSKPDDLHQIEGIGPKVAELLNTAGITTFAVLAETDVDRLNQILDEAKLQYMEPSSWPEQAALAAKGDWKGFETLTAELKGGRRES
jgi:predicted flap endonuclease-1-like 5' DNA nuclease